MKTLLIAALGMGLFGSAALAQGDQAPGTTGSKITTPGQSGSQTPRAQPGASPTLPSDTTSAGDITTTPADTTTTQSDTTTSTGTPAKKN